MKDIVNNSEGEGEGEGEGEMLMEEGKILRILQGASCIIDRICNANNMDPSKRMNCRFGAFSVPDISIYNYMQRLNFYLDCSGSCFVATLIYIDRLLESETETENTVVLNSMTVHRLICVALVIACKYWEDVTLEAAFYAQCGGFSVDEIAALEFLFLEEINFNLHIDQETYEVYENEIMLHVSYCDTCQSSKMLDNYAVLSPKGGASKDVRSPVLSSKNSYENMTRSVCKKHHHSSHSPASISASESGLASLSGPSKEFETPNLYSTDESPNVSMFDTGDLLVSPPENAMSELESVLEEVKFIKLDEPGNLAISLKTIRGIIS